MLSAPATPYQGSPAHDVTAEQDLFRGSLTRTIDGFLAEQRDVLAAISEESLPLISSIATLTGGGKRMRALLCYWGWRAAGGSAGASAPVTAGTALEFFQAAALIHDDIIDRSDTRRGRPSVHRQFTASHTDAGWHLDPERFGVSAAILAGDLCLAFSEELFTSSCSSEAGGAARIIFNRMRTEVMAGQYLDLLEEAVGPDQTPEVAEERALNILRFKSAKYSMERPLMLGGALAGADEALLSAYSAFALPLGEAFQLRDDVLGVFGDPDVTGKPAGDDLREGKRTFLIARALGSSGTDARARINGMLGDTSLDAASVHTLRGLIIASGALAHTEQLIASKSEQAFRALEELDIDAVSMEALRLLAEAAVTRSA
ncbi:MAG: polyprenyl synthetase [Micrococcaceae bacterium]|jgi:geranylgeranyl diphosphate synthase type I|uniref:polyprenyl synthetase family protein n=1 Tax=Arthrobacter sp. PL16 TaxID=3071720 RepID=UPI002DFC4666|nr:polyprenyl synthetase [Micrococcaceae bacterium]MEC5199964.1 geranylgeranyl diphosphate synthase type I [Arthrobacter sp. PL16]